MNTTTDPPQLLIEEPPRDEAEAARLAQLTDLVATADPLPDLIEQGRKKYAALLRHHARQAAGLSIPLTMPEPLALVA